MGVVDVIMMAAVSVVVSLRCKDNGNVWAFSEDSVTCLGTSPFQGMLYGFVDDTEIGISCRISH